MINILIADNHPLFREAISEVLQENIDDCKIHETNDIKQTLVFAKTNKLDLILLEINMPNSRGLSALIDLNTHVKEIPIVIISSETNRQIILQTITYGAIGFIAKSSSRKEINYAVRQILTGKVYLPADIFRTTHKQFVAIQQKNNNPKISPELLFSLTKKQLQVLEAMSQGHSNKEIAYNLNISETTVKSHVSAILKKLGVNNRTQAVIGLPNLDFNEYIKR